MGKIAGLANIELSEQGKLQAIALGKKITSISIDCAYTSTLVRAQQTLTEINTQLQQPIELVIQTSALNERDFGDFTGRAKEELETEFGHEAYTKMLYEWDTSPPQGETMHSIYERVAHFFDTKFGVALKNDQVLLIVTHHHTLRALIQYVEGLSVDQAMAIKLPNASCRRYDFAPASTQLLRSSLI